MTLDLDGLIPATVLPMTDDGEVDEAGLRRYLRWITEQGPVALAVNVDTGEGPHLTHDEKLRVLETARDETSLPIVAGLAGPFTAQAMRAAKDYRSAGASALLVFPIPAFQCSPLEPRMVLDYHRAIADVGLPLVTFQLQPALGGVNYEPALLQQLLDLEGVVAIKEASFDARRFLDTLRAVQEMPKYRAGGLTFLTGNDNFILESFVLGCTGALIGFGAVMTREQVDMIEAWKSGRVDDAKALGQRVQHLADVVFRAPVGNYRVRLKECLVALGVLDAAHVRPPLLPVDDAERELLVRTLADVGLLASAGV